MKLTNGYIGLIWEVPLGLDLGYGYVRLTQLENYFGFYTRILNYRNSKPLKNFKFDDFVNYEELVAPFLTVGRPCQRGIKRWRPLGYLPMKDDDFELPDMKGGYFGDLPPELCSWGIVRGTAASDALRDEAGDPILFRYEQVKHLGSYGHMSLREATSRIILEWMKILGMDYMAYEDEELPKNLLPMQKHQVLVSIPYTEVPKEIRGRVIL